MGVSKAMDYCVLVEIVGYISIRRKNVEHKCPNRRLSYKYRYSVMGG